MPTIIFNGNIVPSDQPCIKHNDRGFTLGHGLFETMLIKNGAIPALDYHWQRLEASAPLIGIAIPFTLQELESMLERLIEQNDLQHKLAGARVTVTHGESERGIFPLQKPKPNYIISVFEHSHTINNDYSACIVDIRKNELAPSSRIKSTSYLDNILAKQEALRQGFNEAILLNTASNIADGAIFNVFMVKNGQIMTPQISDGALPGVIRSMLLQEFKHRFSIVEKSISSQEILDADEVFLTNALMGVQSVSRLNHQTYHSFSTAENIREVLRTEKNYI